MAHLPHGFSAGLIVGSTTVWRWQYQLIQSLIEWGLVDVRKIIILGLPQITSDKSISLLHRLDGKVFSCEVSAFDLVDIATLTGDIHYFDTISSVDINVDILINLSEVSAASECIDMAALCVLTPLFSKGGELRSQRLAVHEYIQGQTEVCLSVLAESKSGGDGVIAEASHSLNSGSLTRNLYQYWVWLAYLWQQAIRFLKQVDDASAETLSILDNCSQKNGASLIGRPVNSDRRHLSVTDTSKAILRLSGHIKQKFQQKYQHTEQWVLLIKHFNYGASGDNEVLDFSGYQELSPPDDCFWADPFVISQDNKNYVFFEELPFATERGHLSCMEVFSDGTHSDPVIILQEDHHLSYPNVFEYESSYYMIPESGDHGTIDVYRCTAFPYQWGHHQTLMSNIHAYDSTLIEHDGHWWLFATVVPEPGLSGCQALHIFYADSPLSTDWQEHSQSPVINRAARARPGGNFFIKDQQLYRVSQDCAGEYGAGINVNKVIELNTERYEETLVYQSYPDWDDKLTALHTLNFNEHIAASDALRVKTKRLF